MAGAGLDRLFITGVWPMVMSGVTSGMNIAENVYLTTELSTLWVRGLYVERIRRLLMPLASTAPQADGMAYRGASRAMRG